jgi:hypothetical protein
VSFSSCNRERSIDFLSNKKLHIELLFRMILECFL